MIWKELESVSEKSPELNAAIQAFVAYYPQVLNDVASKYSQLPHVSVDLCAVPRFIVNREALTEVKKRLGKSQELAELKGGDELIEYFLEELVAQLDAVYTHEANKATPEKPLEIDDKWIVGFNPNYKWRGGSGHYLVYSNSLRTTKNATKDYKKDGKKEAREKLQQLLQWLGPLPQADRDQLEEKLP